MDSLILHGRRLVQLQKWRNLRFPVNLLQNESAFSNSFSSASAAAADVSHGDGRKGQKFTISYLVDSLGLTTKHAESILTKVSSEGKGNPDAILNLLTSHGFTDSQISSIITDYPLLLIADAEKSVGPKLKFLHSRGASSAELTEIVSKVPKILGRRDGKTISRYYDFVKEIIEADKSSKFQKLFRSSLPQGKQENKIRNISVLRELGVPQKKLFSLLISNFNTVCGKEKFEESLKKVVEMGFDPTTSKFVDALNVVYGMTDKAIEEKVNTVCKSLGIAVSDGWQIFKKCPMSLTVSEKNILNSVETFLGLGFTRDEVAMIVKSVPQCLSYSVETVTKKTEFLVKTMNWPLKVVALRPTLLSYSMEKRIVPRCNVIKALLSKGLLGTELPLISSVLVCTDEVFLNRYVMKHDDKELVAELMSILFTGKATTL